MCPPKFMPEKPKFPKGRIEPEHGSSTREVPIVVTVVAALVVLAVSFLHTYLKETGVL